MYSWSAGGIIRLKFSIKMLPDVLLIAEANILPTLRKTASSCAAKALEAQRAGGERGWNVGGKMGQLRSLLFGPLHRAALSGVQVSDQCSLMSFSVLLISNSLCSKRWTGWWGYWRMWEVRYLALELFPLLKG